MQQQFVDLPPPAALACTGVYVENTIEAMQALVATDNGPQGPVPDLHYVEVDIQASVTCY